MIPLVIIVPTTAGHSALYFVDPASLQEACFGKIKFAKGHITLLPSDTSGAKKYKD